MVRTTREQRKALKAVWLRATHPKAEPRETFTYRQFRRGVHPGPDCILVRFAGMWLGIEKNGYTHSWKPTSYTVQRVAATLRIAGLPAKEQNADTVDVGGGITVKVTPRTLKVGAGKPRHTMYEAIVDIANARKAQS